MPRANRYFLPDHEHKRIRVYGSGKAFIQTLFRDVAKETTGTDGRRGCLLMNTASEFAQTDPEIAELVSRTIIRGHTTINSESHIP